MEDEIIASLKPDYIRGLTLLGGDPFEPENQKTLLPFMRRVKAECPGKDVWAYTGYVLDRDLVPGGKCCTADTAELLHMIDVLVDGEFIPAQHDISLRFRGSGNQRIIDLNATRAAGEQIYDAVTGRDVDMEKVHASVAALIRIRAVQDLKPEQAVGVLYLYKSVLRELLLADMLAAGDVQGFLDMGDRLDTLCLMAFNLYLADREQVYAERVAQQRREASQIRRWAARHGLVENQDGE